MPPGLVNFSSGLYHVSANCLTPQPQAYDPCSDAETKRPQFQQWAGRRGGLPKAPDA
jgi:hypothetical protein